MSNPKKGYLQVLSSSSAGDDMFREVPILYAETVKLGAQKIIDLGVHHGLSARTFLIAAIETDGHVWSVDIHRCSYARALIRAWGLANRWTFTVMDDLEYVKTWKGGQVDIVMIDTCHYYDHTLKELEAYAPLVRPGGLVFLHDTIPAHPVIKVHEAIIEFINRHPGEYDFFNHPTVHGLGRLTKKQV